MNRTIAIKLITSKEQSGKIQYLSSKFASACNIIVDMAAENRCWNRVALHHLSYYKTREATDLGSQMCCNAIKSVCQAYKAIKPPDLFGWLFTSLNFVILLVNYFNCKLFNKFNNLERDIILHKPTPLAIRRSIVHWFSSLLWWRLLVPIFFLL